MKCEVFHSYPIFYESDDEEENERFNLRPIFEKSEREYEDDILDVFSALNFSGYQIVEHESNEMFVEKYLVEDV